MGPYTIAEVCGNGSYKLASMDGVRLKTPVAGNRLKKFIPRKDGVTRHVTGIPAEPRQRAPRGSTIPRLDAEEDETPGPIEDTREGVVTRAEAKRRAALAKLPKDKR